MHELLNIVAIAAGFLIVRLVADAISELNRKRRKK